MKIAYVSFGTGGTLGHRTLLNKLKKKIGKENLIILSEYYKKNIPTQKHSPSVGGNLKYIASNKILDICVKKKVTHIIFSTFFDERLVKDLIRRKIKTILFTYPLRDSFALYHQVHGNYNLFDKVYILNDIFPDKYESFPHINLYDSKKKRVGKNIVLITCGGGGRPSANRFCEIVDKKFLPLLKNEEIKIILGPYNNYKFENLTKNVECITSCAKLDGFYKNAKFVIGEAGYHTVQELLQYQIPAFLIPGERRIDNQEIRAIYFQKNNFAETILQIVI